MFDVTHFNWQEWDEVQRLFWAVFQIFSLAVFCLCMAWMKTIFFKIWTFCFLLCDPRKYLTEGIPERKSPNIIEQFGLFLLAIAVSCYFGYKRLHMICPWWID